MNFSFKNIVPALFTRREGIEPENATAKQAIVERDLLIRVIKRQKSLYRKDMEKWRQGHQAALSITKPQRTMLLDVYDDCVLDTHLTAVMGSRFLRTLNTPFEIVDDNGKRDDEATKLINKRWALNFNKLALESIFYGYSLIKLEKGNDGLTGVKLFPREHVVPELGGIRPDVNGDEVIHYINPPESLYYIGIGDPTDLGLLLKAAPMCIFKKNAMGHWSKYQEIYGIPPRIAKTASRDKEVQAEIINWLVEMGSSSYGLFPADVNFETLEAAGTDAFQVFDKGVDRANTELSKLVLLQTMTTDSGSSHSQSETHQTKEDEVIESDLVFLEYEWNDKLIPILIQHGYKLEGKRFTFDRTKQLYPAEQWKIVDGLLKQGYIIPEDYIRKAFYVPVEGREKPVAPVNTPPAKDDGDDPKNSFVNLRDEINNLYQ